MIGCPRSRMKNYPQKSIEKALISAHPGASACRRRSQQPKRTSLSVLHINRDNVCSVCIKSSHLEAIPLAATAHDKRPSLGIRERAAATLHAQVQRREHFLYNNIIYFWRMRQVACVGRLKCRLVALILAVAVVSSRQPMNSLQ